MADREKNIGESKLTSSPSKSFKFSLKDGAIKNRHIDDDAIDTNNIKDGVITGTKIADETITAYKLAPGITDYILSAASKDIDEIWKKLEEITGESLNGITMTVTPQYYIGESCLVHISANTIRTYGIFEHIRFYWNFDETPFLEENHVQGISEIVELPVEKLINSKIIIRCEAQIMGRIYNEQKEITHYESFFIGAGATYQDLMLNGGFNPVYSKPIARHMRAAYDVNVAEDDHIIIAMGESLRPGFIRADISGIEIAFTEQTITVNDTVYAVLTSVNTYSEGTINVDING